MQKPRHKKILYILLSVIILFVIALFCVIFFMPKFYIIDFNSKVFIDYGSNYQLTPGNVCYGNEFYCDDVSVSVEGEVDTKQIGKYKVVYTFKYHNKKTKKVQIVEVVDKESPKITIDTDEVVYCPNGNMMDYNLLAIDNVDGDVTSKVIKKINQNEIIFKVSDSSGNNSQIVKKAKLQDKEKPMITLNGAKTMYVHLNEKYVEQGAKAIDNCDGNLSAKITTTGIVDTSKVGQYLITYTVTDMFGNKSQSTREVWVYKNNDNYEEEAKTIYLTFDDGPGPYTDKLLDILKKYDVKATFFVTDQAITKRYDQTIKRAYDEGHTIGLHTATHNYKNIYSSKENYFKDLYSIQDKVKKITGHTAMIIRFPGGSSNTISKKYDNNEKIMSSLTKEVKARGFRYFDWNISSGDAGETTNTNKIVDNVVYSLGENNSYVILQHDIKGYSVDAVEKIIQYGLTHGYTFKALDMNSPKVEHHVNN